MLLLIAWLNLEYDIIIMVLFLNISLYIVFCYSLNECHRPNRDHLRRLSTQICVWIFEARNLQPKKKYFCEVYLNNILYCQTCCKLMNDILFWGEPFIFE